MAEIRYEITAEFDFDEVTKGWTEDERQLLLDMDLEAVEQAQSACLGLLAAGRFEEVDSDLDVTP